MKKFFLFAFLTIIGLNACSDSNADVIIPEEPEDENIMVTAAIQLPGTDAVPYADVVNTSDELKIENIQLYTFVDENGEFVFSQLYEFETGDFTNLVTSIELNFDVKEPAGDMKFYFVANGADVTSLKFVSTEDGYKESDFLAAMTNEAFQGVISGGAMEPLLMTTDSVRMTKDALLADDPVLPTLSFNRVAMRVDIVNTDKTLAITKVQFKNTPKRSLIFNRAKTDGSWTFPSIARTDMPAVEIDNTLRFPPGHSSLQAEDRGDSLHLKGLFYPYEGVIESATLGNTSIYIEGDLYTTAGVNTGSKVIHTINLASGTSGGVKAQLLKRNFRYILLIQSSLASPSFFLNAEDWLSDPDE